MIRESMNKLTRRIFIVLLIVAAGAIPLSLLSENVDYNGGFPEAAFASGGDGLLVILIFGMVALAVVTYLFFAVWPIVMDLGQAMWQRFENRGEDFP